MLLAEDLKNAILQAAVQGKLVRQHQEEGDAEELYHNIQEEKQQLINAGIIKNDKPLLQITDDEIPFDIPDNWKWVRLGDVCKKLTDGSHNPPPKTTHGYVVISAKNIKKGHIEISSNERYCDAEGFKKENTRTNIKKGDIVLGIIGGSIGNVAIFDIDEQVIAQRSISIIDTFIENRFVAYVIRTPFVQNALKTATGTAQGGMYLGALRSLIMPLPPIKEQRRIIDKLDVVLDEIDVYGEAEVELESLQKSFPEDIKNSVIQYAMQGKLVEQRLEEGTGEELYHSIKVKKDELIKEGKIKKEKSLFEITDDEIPFDIPDSWRWVRFGEIVDFRLGKTPPRIDAKAWGDDYRWVSISDMVSDGHVNQTKEGISENGFHSAFGGVISPKGTLIMSFKLTIGCVSILDIDALHNEAIISIFPIINNDDIMRDYLFKIMPYVSKTGDSKKAIKGNTLNSKSINNLLVPLPPLAEQRRIVDKLDAILPLVNELSEVV